MCVLPEVEVGEGLQLAQAGRKGPHTVVVQAERLHRDKLTHLLWHLTEPVLRQV